MDLGLAGQVALVTGGSKGIGKATARALLAEGARVALLARGQEALDAARAELGDVLTVAADTTSDEAVRSAVDAVVSHFGGLDVVVNSGAMSMSTTASAAKPGILDLDDEDFLRQVDSKALGYLRVARAAVPHLRAAGGGRIVNVSGMNARKTGSIAGSVRNIAVVALTKNLADELGRDNIAVTCVHPGTTWTDTRAWSDRLQALSEANALGRTITADEVAGVIAFLASPRATLLNGAIIEADGGLPGALFT